MKQTKRIKTQKQDRDMPLIIVTTGGSGGHIFPAEAITGALLKKGYRVAFVTDKRGSAFRSLNNVPTYRLSAESVARRTVFQKITAGVKLIFGAVQAIWLLMRLKPALVIGVGGYASFPTVMAAQVCRIPTVLHEQNAVLGRANRTLASGARLIATSFEPTYMIPNGVEQIRVGMPARPAVLALEKSPFPTDKKNFHLLIFGGSQGATFFSHRFPEVLAKLPSEYQRKLIITQQARPEDKESLIHFYQQHGFENVTVSSFFDNMPELIKQAHLVIARGGASTITELEVIGRPAVLVPLPTAADNHQMENARQFCDSGAGWLVNEKEFDAEQVAQRLLELMKTPDELKTAAERAYQRACPKAALEVVARVTQILKGK